MSGDNQSGWAEWSKHVLAELKQLRTDLRNVSDKIDADKEASLEKISALKVEVAMLKVKSSIFGLVGGLVPVSIMIIMRILSK